MKKIFCFYILLLILTPHFGQEKGLPEGFVYVKDLIPDVVTEMRYTGNNNFIGRPIRGYNEQVVILSSPAATALKNVQEDLKKRGYCLKIFDAYRPQRAVNNFMEWAKDVDDTIMKQKFYPAVDKKDLFNLGYIASRSGHSRGSTVDLTIIDATTGKELDMGSSYDLFGEISHHDSPKVTPQQKKNRELLKNTMKKYGFTPYAQEWWHYTYQPEPFPETYFDFEVE